MRKSGLITLILVSSACLLLVSASLNTPNFQRPGLYVITLWLSTFLSFAVFSVALIEFALSQRALFLYLATTFCCVGMLGLWNAITLPPDITLAKPSDVGWKQVALWEIQWLILGIGLITSAFSGRERGTGRRHDVTSSSAVLGIGILFASVIIFVITLTSWISRLVLDDKLRTMTIVISATMLFVSAIIYSRAWLHRGNNIVIWTSYGLSFAVLGQISLVISRQPSQSMLGFSGIMQVIFFICPLAGMIAEHGNLQAKLRRQAADLNNLIQTQQAVSSIARPAELYQRIVDLIANSTSCSAVSLMIFERERGLLRTAAQTGFDGDTAKQLVFRPSEGPAGDAYSEKSPIFVRDIHLDPVLSQKLNGVSDIGSAVFLPLIAYGECLGILAVFFGGRPFQRLSKDNSRLLDALSNQAALAVHASRLQGKVIDTSRESDAYARELETMWEIGQAIASKLEINELVDTLANKLATVVGGTNCSVLVFDSNSVSLRIVGRQKLTRHRSIADHVDHCDIIAAEVAKSGEPMIVNNVPNSQYCKYPELAGEDGGVHHLLCVPMALRGLVGAISIFRHNSPPFSEKDKDFVMRLSPMVAVGIRNADLYERERAIAHSLQESMLPDISKDYDHIQIAVSYEAPLDESVVGGDFYDVVEFGDGRYGVGIGDVAGKGVDAAVYTAMARYMIRAYSADDPDPLYVVPRLNAALCRYMPSGKFVTLVYGVLDTKSRTFRYVNAGHELPFVYRYDERILDTLVTTGPAAGALIDSEYTSESICFNSGDVFVFYTDGATEVKRHGKFLETEGLKAIVLEELKGEFLDLPERIMEAIRRYGDTLRDDVAILAIKIRRPGALF